MLFNSFDFFIFFPLVTIFYFLIPHKYRWFLLLVASCVFYMAFIPAYILILAITILIDYFAGMLIEKAEGKKKKTYLVISILSTCLVLFVFKYFNFFNTNFYAVAKFFHWNYPIKLVEIILPIGLSFHTFQSLSYVIEVYRGNQKAERNFGIYSLYVMFYPQLVAGPIERPQNLLHQFYEKHYFEYKRVTDGLKLMLWGLFKKIVIADRLALVVNKVYDNPQSYNGPYFIIATLFFTYQIYCDFSGYSDIARGSAQVMGFRIMDNFNRPYFSKSISEFWKRWHISLSTWFRDYLYVSLGGNKVTKWRWYFNLLITFFISGLWHGANWTYIFWGVLNGFYLVFSICTRNVRQQILSFLSIAGNHLILQYVSVFITFALICFSWIFFRAKSLSDAFYIVAHIPDGIMEILTKIVSGGGNFILSETFLGLNLGVSTNVFIFSVCLIIFVEIVHMMQQRHGSIRHLLSVKPVWFRWPIYYCLILSILFFAVDSKESFIYFQF